MNRSAGIVGAVVASIAGLAVVSMLRTSVDSNRIAGYSIVMLGDSITAEADWNRLLPDQPLVNEGHPGFTTAQLITVAERIAAADPAAIVVLTGTNDIRDGRPAAWTRARLEQLIDRLEHRDQPRVPVAVESGSRVDLEKIRLAGVGAVCLVAGPGAPPAVTVIDLVDRESQSHRFDSIRRSPRHRWSRNAFA